MEKKVLMCTPETIKALKDLQNLKPKLRDLFTIILRKYARKTR